MRDKIIVTGAKGQLGSELQSLASSFPQYEFIYTDKEELSIDDENAVDEFFNQHNPQYCINCAAYTAVDKAESDRKLAMMINATAPGILARACTRFGVRYVHISTDYVFNGQSDTPYSVDTPTDPVNYYGYSKMVGEQNVVRENPEAIIIRTAWVYSEYGNNFVKTMMRLMSERDAINVVSDQVGAPTYAKDLANAILKILSSGKWVSGFYHYSNSGKISWYDFACAIRDFIGSPCKVNPIPSSSYPTPASRPAFSLLDTSRIRLEYEVAIPDWKESLRFCISRLKQDAS